MFITHYTGRHRIGLGLPAGSGFLPVLVDTPSGAGDWVIWYPGWYPRREFGRHL